MKSSKTSTSLIAENSHLSVNRDINITNYNLREKISFKRPRTSRGESAHLTETFSFLQKESTSFEEIQFTYKLIFQEFHDKIFENPQTNPLKSKHFSPPNRNEPKFSLELWLKGEKEQNRDYVSLFLHSLLEKYTKEIILQYKMAIIDRNKLEKNSKDGTVKLCQEEKSGWEKYIKHEELLEQRNVIFDKNELTINCQIKYDQKMFSMLQNQIASQNQTEAKIKPSTNNYSHRWEMRKYSDLKIFSNEMHFDVHKLVLDDRAPKFAEIHEIELKNEIIIDDIDANVFKEMLRFFYTNEIYLVEKFAAELFVQAEKYDLTDLREQVENVLITKLSNDTVCDILVLAQTHKATTLKREAIEYLKDNYSVIENYCGDKLSIIDSSLWKEIFRICRKDDPYSEIRRI